MFLLSGRTHVNTYTHGRLSALYQALGLPYSAWKVGHNLPQERKSLDIPRSPIDGEHRP